MVSGGIPIPKILPYKDLMHIINNVDIGKLIPVGNLCKGVQMDVGGVYRNIETLLVSLAKFYLDTNCYRKPDGLEVKLLISELLLVVMVHHLASGMSWCHGWSVS